MKTTEIISIIAITISIISIIITLLNNRKTIRIRKKVSEIQEQALKTQKDTYNESQFSKFNSFLKDLLEVDQTMYMLRITPDDKKDLLYDTKLRNLYQSRASIVENAYELGKEVQNKITASNCTELAKGLFGVNEFEKAEAYHLLAIEKSKGNQILASRRSYADFLFYIGKNEKGRDEYKKCMADEDTDNNKGQNVKTLAMLVYNEAQLDNNKEEAMKIWNKAKNLASRISIPDERNNHILALENLKKQLWEI